MPESQLKKIRSVRSSGTNYNPVPKGCELNREFVKELLDETVRCRDEHKARKHLMDHWSYDFQLDRLESKTSTLLWLLGIMAY